MPTSVIPLEWQPFFADFGGQFQAAPQGHRGGIPKLHEMDRQRLLDHYNWLSANGAVSQSPDMISVQDGAGYGVRGPVYMGAGGRIPDSAVAELKRLTGADTLEPWMFHADSVMGRIGKLDEDYAHITHHGDDIGDARSPYADGVRPGSALEARLQKNKRDQTTPQLDEMFRRQGGAVRWLQGQGLTQPTGIGWQEGNKTGTGHSWLPADDLWMDPERGSRAFTDPRYAHLDLTRIVDPADIGVGLQNKGEGWNNNDLADRLNGMSVLDRARFWNADGVHVPADDPLNQFGQAMWIRGDAFPDVQADSYEPGPDLLGDFLIPALLSAGISWGAAPALATALNTGNAMMNSAIAKAIMGAVTSGATGGNPVMGAIAGGASGAAGGMFGGTPGVSDAGAFDQWGSAASGAAGAPTVFDGFAGNAGATVGDAAAGAVGGGGGGLPFPSPNIVDQSGFQMTPIPGTEPQISVPTTPTEYYLPPAVQEIFKQLGVPVPVPPATPPESGGGTQPSGGSTGTKNPLTSIGKQLGTAAAVGGVGALLSGGGGGGGPADDPEALSSSLEADEAARQAAKRAAAGSVGNAFSGFDDSYYGGISKAYRDFQMPLLDEQFREAARRLPLTVARTDSSAFARKRGNLQTDYEREKVNIARGGEDEANRRRTAVENARSSLLSQAELGAGLDSAASQAASVAAAMAAPPAFSPIGDLFSKYTANMLNARTAADSGYRPVRPLLFGDSAGRRSQSIVYS
jgi:hypothetical protein